MTDKYPDVLADNNASEDYYADQGEFTSYCNRFYRLTDMLATREERLHNMLENAPLYNGETRLSDIDALITYYREVQLAQQQVDDTQESLRKTERIILMIMRHFEIPPETMLTGQIPGELAYKIWANENDTVYIKKVIDLEPVEVKENVIVIKVLEWEDTAPTKAGWKRKSARD